jgi:GTP-binding protein
MTSNIVAIVGRPNVGKSTFFNRLIGARHSIVDDTAGVTRDRIYHDTDWAGHEFLVIDTGGIVFDKQETLAKQIYDQVKLALEEADVIIFMVDGKAGLVGTDHDVANILRKAKKPVILAVNKVDQPSDEQNVGEFYELGLGEPFGLSALRGTGGVGDLLDKIVAHFPPRKLIEETFDLDEDGDDEEGRKKFDPNGPLSIAVVGKPNVGKSSMVNLLCGKTRSIVSAEPGTTRDAIDTRIVYKGCPITLIDTAGIRRKSRVDYGIEAFSVVRSLKAIERADVVVLMLDAAQEITDQDHKIAGKIAEAGKAAVIVMNKWDLIENKSSQLMNEYSENLKQDLRALSFAEVVYTSAATRQRTHKVLDAAQKAWEEANRRIPTSILNQVVNESVALVPPPSSSRGKRLRIYYCTQASVKPPTFVLFVNDTKLMTQSYETYLERKLRESSGFNGTPIRIILRPKR